jgi:hypothetical protein
MQLIVTPSGVRATPVSAPHCERGVRMPTSGGDAIHTRFALHASVPPDAERAKLYRVFWAHESPRATPRAMYGTHAWLVPSHVPGYADAVGADTIGAARNAQPNANAAMSLMGLA